jgi:glycine dehydrogenase subunit 1
VAARVPVPTHVPYVPHTPLDIEAMLDAIGIADVADLFQQIPARLRADAAMDLPPSLSEPEVREHLEALAAQNRTAGTSAFVGGGCYPHFVPAAVDKLLLRGEFATAYTPYQPEVSQGTLQATFEFQSLVALLFGLDVANASMYDAASATAEAVLMARRMRPDRHTVWVSRAVHPQYRRTIATYTTGLDITYREAPIGADGATDWSALDERTLRDTACVVLGYPNVLGVLEDVGAVARVARPADALVITTTAEPLALGLCKAPGSLGADIAVGEGQSLGLPLSYGGPGVGLFATRDPFVRHMPGRVVGATVDAEGRRGYVLTLATREQHIRRERATSNICTNQTLCAVAVTIYLSLLGKQGLHALAELNYRRAHQAAARLRAHGARLRFSAPFFNEFVIELPDARHRWEELAEQGMLAGIRLDDWYPELANCLLITVTEVHGATDIDRLVNGISAKQNGRGAIDATA